MELTAEELRSIVSSAVTTALSSQQNLDNCKRNTGESYEEDSEMAYQYSERYSFIDTLGNRQVVRLYGTSKADTDMKFQRLLSEHSPQTEQSSMIFRKFAEEIYLQKHTSKIKPQTVASHRTLLKNLCLFIGDKPISDITTEDIQTIIDTLATTGGVKSVPMSTKTILLHIQLMHKLYGLAIDLGMLTNNPVKMRLLNFKGRELRHHVALSYEQIFELKKEIPKLKDERDKLFMGFLVYTGMRKGEILGLRWEDINLEEGYASIKRAVSSFSEHPTYVHEPKTAGSCRDIILPEPLLEIIKSCQNKTGFLVSGTEEPRDMNSVTYMIRTLFKRLGLKGYSCHDFRVTYATQLKESGMPLQFIADLLGHSGTRMVEQIYGRRRHETVMLQKDAVNLVSKMGLDTNLDTKTAL